MENLLEYGQKKFKKRLDKYFKRGIILTTSSIKGNKMKKITIGRQRKDGKFYVTYWYEGAENMFGGREYPSVFKKIHTLDKIVDHYMSEEDIFVNLSGLPDNYFNFKAL